MTDPAAAAKRATRLSARTLRAGCDPALGAAMAEHVLRDCLPPAGAIVGGFWPLPGELDMRPLLTQLTTRGYAVALPETPPTGQALQFREWLPDDVLIEGRYGTLHTDGPELAPDFLLVPLLAFDGTGNRLGYGGGFYDRTLAALTNAFRLGCAFSAQEIELVPVGPHDMALHAVATELGVRRF